MINTWNRNTPQDTSSEATQKSKGARTTSYDIESPNGNTKQLVSLENDEKKSTNNDTTELVASSKRSAIENTEAIEPDPKRIGIEARALVMRPLDHESKQVAHDTNAF